MLQQSDVCCLILNHTPISSQCKTLPLRQLKRARLDKNMVLYFYTTCNCPVNEYVCQVFCNSLHNYLSEEIERLQQRAMRIIHPDVKYSDVLNLTGLDSLSN